MTDREILEKYINLDNSCLNEEEKVKVMNMLFDYKEANCLEPIYNTWAMRYLFKIGRNVYNP